MVRRFCVFRKVITARTLPDIDNNATAEIATENTALNAYGTSVLSSSCMIERNSRIVHDDEGDHGLRFFCILFKASNWLGLYEAQGKEFD